jgi:hypothetical protein
MRNRFIGFRVLLCAFALALLCANGLWAQSQSAEKPVSYTYVSEWAVPRAMWADYQKIEAAGNDNMKKAVADGTLTGFGNFSVLNHQEGSPTHGSWFTASSLANILKVLEGLRAAPASVAPPLAASKHWDYILSSRTYDSHSGTFTNGYLRVGNWRPKAGSSDPDGKVMKATIGALLEKLMADGALHSYSIDTETIHSADPGGFYVAIVANGAEGLDKFNGAVEEGPKNNPAGWAGYGSTVDSNGHRDFLARVDAMTHK